ncbi:MAG: glycosyltransferase family 4 protein [Candidatus Omnitrophica bacterium]|nr:glycosyltransferase family 4 protein [Candidatus Omnitrophota bacterium]
MKILVLANAMSTLSGGDKRFIEIFKRFKAQGHSVKVMIPRIGYEICKNENLNVSYQILPIRSENNLGPILSNLLRLAIANLVVIKNLRKQSIVYSTSDFFNDTIPAIFLKSIDKKVKWIASVYHIIPHPSRRPGKFSFSNFFSFIAQRMSLLLIARWSDMIQTEANFVRDELMRRYRISPEKIIVCQSGINPKVIDHFSWSQGKIYDACFLARLHKSKGIHDLIEAWQCLCKYKDAKLAIAGGGPIEIINEVKIRIKNLGLENNVFYLGFLSEEEKYKLLRTSKLYVLPSYEEGIPIAFYEAMYCGLPIVTYYLPPYADIKDYILSVPLGAVHSLALEILRVLEDDDLIHMLGERGRSLAKEHTWDRIADYLISKLDKMLSKENSIVKDFPNECSLSASHSFK